MKTLSKLLLVEEIAQQVNCFDYPYFKENFMLIAIDLSKKQALDADPKAVQQIYFTGNLEQAGNTTIFCS